MDNYNTTSDSRGNTPGVFQAVKCLSLNRVISHLLHVTVTAAMFLVTLLPDQYYCCVWLLFNLKNRVRHELLAFRKAPLLRRLIDARPET